MPDMIPVLGEALLLGKCRYCYAEISVRRPVTEAFEAFFGITFWKVFEFSLQGSGRRNIIMEKIDFRRMGFL